VLNISCLKNREIAEHLWFTPIILDTKEAEIRRINVRSQPGQIVFKTLSQKYPTQNKAGGVAQVVRVPD
jgi:hypothetical protein